VNPLTHYRDGAAVRHASAAVALLVFCATSFSAPPRAAPPSELRSEMSVELPPLIVEDAPTVKWRYCETPRAQILSRCSDGITQDFVRAEQRLTSLLQLVIPPEYQAHFSAPHTILLSNGRTTSAAIQKLLADSNRVPASVASALKADSAAASSNTPGEAARRLDIRLMPNLRLDDHDVVATFAMIDERTFNDSTIGLTASHIYMLLNLRAPPLPHWLVSGIVALVPSIRYRDEFIGIEPARWWPHSDSKSLLTDAEYPRTLLPMSDFFAERDGGQPELWYTQAALFVRWALDAEDATMRDRFWRFVDRCGAGPADESVFIECFGFGYADMRDRLSDYLPTAVSTAVILRPAKRIQYFNPKIRTATAADIARVKGEWERLAINFVRANHPEFASLYETQARSTLAKLKTSDESDARLQCVAGLYFCGEGNDAEAVRYLEAAVRGKVARPRPYFELARIRFLNAKAAPAGADKRLSTAQAQSILELLGSAQNFSPKLPATFILTAETLFNSELKPTAEHFAQMEEAVRLFPNNPAVLLRAAVLYAASGKNTRAAELVVQGLEVAKDDETRGYFLQLQQGLRSGVVLPKG
jgi:hypothetical protein